MPLNTSQILQNRYRIVKLIGQGGFGAVYKAWDESTQQIVAVKENLIADAAAQRQFKREAVMMAALRHPNLPRVVDHFVIDGQGEYLVMDYVEGRSLAAIYNERGAPLSEHELLPWIIQICQALDYLHTRQPPIIHRDVKPDNVIITPDGRAMLVDFGISKQFYQQQATTIGARAITPGYSPPEQYGYGQTDARTDIYALGALMYALFTGNEPTESVQRIAGSRLSPPHDVNPDISLKTSRAIMDAMRLNADKRFPTVAALQEALPQTNRGGRDETDIHSQTFSRLKADWTGLAALWGKQPLALRVGLISLILVLLCSGSLIAASLSLPSPSITPLPTRQAMAELPLTVQLPATYTPPPTLRPAPTQTPRPRPTLTPRPTPFPSATVSVSSSPSASVGGELPQPNNSILVDGWEVRVERVLLAETVTGIGGGVEKAAGRFALVFMTATNRRLSREVFIAFGSLEIEDAQGIRYRERHLASAYAAYMHNTESGVYVNPDETGRFVAVFDISKQSDYYRLVPGQLARHYEGFILLNIP